MRLGFFTVFRRDPRPYVQAEAMIHSARAAMPGVEVTQFTDATSPAVLGVDEVRRLAGGKMLEVRLQHYAACAGEWLFVDSDVLVRRDVRSVFDDHSFDVALAARDWEHLKDESAKLTTQGMPYNTGVAFSRSPMFWRDVLARWCALPDEQKDWLSEQRVVGTVLAERTYHLRVLPGWFNYPPGPDGIVPREAWITHYKGGRKDVMLEHARAMRPPEGTVAAAVAAALERPSTVPLPRVREVLPVCLGYDPRQPIAFHVAAHSITRHASRPVAIIRLQLDQLPITRRGLTEFTYSRFLVPWLCGFQGQAVFADADVLCRGDITELFALAARQVKAAVAVVQNARRFEWASLMAFNNAACEALTPDYVQDPTHGMFDMAWAVGVGALPAEWNHLEG